jgi:hypothetical protein
LVDQEHVPSDADAEAVSALVPHDDVCHGPRPVPSVASTVARDRPGAPGRPARKIGDEGPPQVGCPGPASGGFGVDIIIDFVKFGLIFGILGTAPIVTWLAVSWLFTDRRRSSRPRAG